MKQHWTRIRRAWNREDTLLLATNVASLLLFIGNTWWESLSIVYLGTIAPLALQGAYGLSRRQLLWRAWLFGAGAGLSWPLFEFTMAHTVGWWGAYLASSPMLLETPVYGALIGWLSATYAYYVVLRILELGYSPRAAAINGGLVGFGLGAAGENLFVHAGMWEYMHARWPIGAVPAFIPIAYGAVLMAVPWARRVPPLVCGVVFSGLVLGGSVLLGLLTGFFPQR